MVAVGCLAERYGAELADSLPEADAVLGFDDYTDISEPAALHRGGGAAARRTPRRTGGSCCPSAPPSGRPSPPRRHRRSSSAPGSPTHRGPRSSSPAGATGAARSARSRSFRGSFVSRRPSDVVAEAAWLAGQGARELFLVSENSTSYGKDLGDLKLLETLLPELASLDGVDRVRVSYLQPAETRPGLVEAIATTPGVAAYFDLSFQHASATVLRRMRRFGDPDSFLGLLDQVRSYAPEAGVRSNVIVGFPGETEDDLQTLCDFLVAARLDVTGVFGYSDEDGTEAASYDDKHDDDEIAARVRHVTDLVAELTAQRAEERIGSTVEVLVEEIDEDGAAEGRAAQQGPEVDGTTRIERADGLQVGDLVRAVVVATDGVDLVARTEGNR